MTGPQSAAAGPFKLCAKCGIAKLPSEFTRDRSKKDGRRNECRDCKHAAAKLYRQANRDAINAKTAQWRKANPDRSRTGARRVYQRLRETVLDHYGRACACCGGTERLSIDHINGDGASHREELFGTRHEPGAGRIYRWLVANGFPEGFQTLCMPCNQSKGRGECCNRDHTADPLDMRRAG